MFFKKTITTIHIRSILFLLLFVVLFLSLVIYKEYNDFGRKEIHIRSKYLQEQKSAILYDTNRVIEFIRHTYDSKKATTPAPILQQETIDAIEHLYGRKDGTGYIFIYDFNGTNLSDPIQSYNRGKNLYGFKDSKGVEVIKDLIDVSKNKEGGYVTYEWFKPTSGKPGRKISYAKSFAPYGWMIGTGVYLDEVEKLITAERDALRDDLLKFLMEMLSLSVLLLIVGLTTIMAINRIIKREIDTFSSFFGSTAGSYTLIDEKDIRLDEFKGMVTHVNSMVTQIAAQQESLREINASLEQRIELKTQKLARLISAQDSFIKHSIHEINTPLAVIMTHIDIYKMKYPPNRYISKIEAGAKMISTIYDDLGYIVKKDRLVYEKKHLDFSRFLQERIDFFEEIATGNLHRIIASIEDGIEIVFNDIELQRVIDNNLSNAIKFARKESDIAVNLKRDGESVTLEFITRSKQITDTAKIFEAFHREATTQEGFGLGLEIVGTICQNEGVEIAVESNSDRTVFSYRFPAPKSGTV